MKENLALINIEKSSDIKFSSWKLLAASSNKEARELLDFRHAEKLIALPLYTKEEGGRKILKTAVCNNCSPSNIKEISFATGLEAEAESVEANALKTAVYLSYQGSHETLNEKLLRPDPSAPELLEAIINRAILLGASDIHFEPSLDSSRLRFRIHGRLTEETHDRTFHLAYPELLRRMKVMSSIDTTIINLPQEGAWSHYAANLTVRLRASFIPQAGQQKVVLRLLDDSFLDAALKQNENILRYLGLDEMQDALFRFHLAADSGAIIVCGPTGSGKSTLLYAALELLNQEFRNIVTIEDPIERIVHGVNQIEVNRERTLGFSDILPLVLRQDPDILMIGEMRDKESTALALDAAMTGKLVLSTLHAANCIEGILRLCRLGVEEQLVFNTVKLFIAQRLVRLNCPNCLIGCSVSIAIQKIFAFDASTKLARATGCSRCNYIGISSRHGVFEVLPITEDFKTNVLSMCKFDKNLFDAKKISEFARENNYRSFTWGVRKLLLGQKISPENALVALGVAPELAATSLP